MTHLSLKRVICKKREMESLATPAVRKPGTEVQWKWCEPALGEASPTPFFFSHSTLNPKQLSTYMWRLMTRMTSACGVMNTW